MAAAGCSVIWTGDAGRTAFSLLAFYLLAWAIAHSVGKAPAKEKLLRFLIMTGSLAVTIALLELGAALRVVDFARLFAVEIKQPWFRPENRLDRQLLHIHLPHLEVGPAEVDADLAPLAGDDTERLHVHYLCDANGFRNATTPARAEIVVLGDSFVEAAQVATSEMMTTKLAEELQVAVANLGQSWYGPQQELEVLRRYGLGLNPDACVWMFFEGNDLDDVHRYTRTVERWADLFGPVSSLQRRSFTRNAMRLILKLARPVAHPEGSQSGLFTAADGERARIYFGYQENPLSEADEDALVVLGSVFAQAQDLCATNAAELLIVFIPTKFRVYRDLLDLDRDASPAVDLTNDLPSRIAEIVQSSAPEATFLDLTPAMTAAASEGRLVYLRTDTHWSPVGHAIAAREIAARLQVADKTGP